MRIISDFHDYYDAAAATGQDQTLIYHRKSEERKFAEYPFPVLDYSTCHRPDLFALELQQYIIGFCGKIYPVLALTLGTANKATICHNLEEVDCFIEQNFRKAAIEEYRTKAKRRSWRWHYWPSDIRRDTFKKHFTSCADKKNSFVGMFLKEKCPVFVAAPDMDVRYVRGMAGSGNVITYNGCLKELEFFRLFDTFTAFQEIAMFLGGLAVPLKEIPQVPDKIMVGVKGFDEWSFRKPPSKKC